MTNEQVRSEILIDLKQSISNLERAAAAAQKVQDVMGASPRELERAERAFQRLGEASVGAGQSLARAREEIKTLNGVIRAADSEIKFLENALVKAQKAADKAGADLKKALDFRSGGGSGNRLSAELLEIQDRAADAARELQRLNNRWVELVQNRRMADAHTLTKSYGGNFGEGIIGSNFYTADLGHLLRVQNQFAESTRTMRGELDHMTQTRLEEASLLDLVTTRTNLLTQAEKEGLQVSREVLRMLDRRIASMSSAAKAAVSNDLGTVGNYNPFGLSVNAGPMQYLPVSRNAAVGMELLAASTSKATREQQRFNNEVNVAGFRINAMRYALYDVSATFERLSGVFLGPVTTVFSASIDWAEDFAQVIRTAELESEASISAIRAQFLDLQTSIPVEPDEIARIGSLAGQLGIAASNLRDFTSVTARFSATTNLGVEEAATALGRINTLLPEIDDDFNRLASTILSVGISSVATEDQITRTATQIAAMGRTAGVSAADVIGLSGAMASLGATPELSRSVITSSFSRIMTATGELSDKTEAFGKVLNMTGREFQRAWREDAMETYVQFLQAVAARDDSVQVLQDLRLASQRLTPNLLRLGQNTDEVRRLLKVANDEWEVATSLTKQYDIIAGTTAAKIRRLSGTINALFEDIGQGGEVFAPFLDFAQRRLEEIRILLRDPVFAGFVNVLIGIAAAAGGILALGAAFATAGAGALGIRFVLEQMISTSPFAEAALARFGITAQRMGVQSSIAAGQVGGLNAAMNASTGAGAGAAFGKFAGALGVVGLAVTALTISLTAGKAAWDLFASGIPTEELFRVDEVIHSISNAETRKQGVPLIEMDFTMGDAFDAAKLGARTVTTVLSPFGALFVPFFEEAMPSADKLRAELDKRMVEVLRDGNRAAVQKAITEAAEKQGISVEELLAKYPELNRELLAMAEANGSAATATEFLTDAMFLAEDGADAATIQMEKFADATGRTKEQVEELIGAIQSGSSSIFDMGAALEKAYQAEERNAQGEITQEAGGGLAEFRESLAQGIADLATWQNELQQLAARGAPEMYKFFAEQGLAGQQGLRDVLTLSDADIATMEEQMRIVAVRQSTAYATTMAYYEPVFMEALRAGGQGLLSQVIAAAEQEVISGGDGLVEKVLETWNANEARKFIITPDMNLDNYDAAMEEALKTKNEFEASGLNLKAYVDMSDVSRSIRAYQGSGITLRAYMDRYGATGGLVRDGDILPKFNRGGGVGYNQSGMFRGPGTGTSDDILAMVSNGEFINNAASVRHYGAQFFDMLNRRQFPTMRELSGMMAGAAQSGPQSVTNVNVVQNYPQTVNPLTELKTQSENLVAGIWGN